LPANKKCKDADRKLKKQRKTKEQRGPKNAVEKQRYGMIQKIL
jgi:hypothetical protein